MDKTEKLACLNALAALPPLSDSTIQIAHAIACGILHSNIPACCVAWFIRGEPTWTAEEKATYHTLEEECFPGGYAPCPACFAAFLKSGSFRKVKDCACECPCCGCERQRNPEGVCRHGKASSEEGSEDLPFTTKDGTPTNRRFEPFTPEAIALFEENASEGGATALLMLDVAKLPEDQQDDAQDKLLADGLLAWSYDEQGECEGTLATKKAADILVCQGRLEYVNDPIKGHLCTRRPGGKFHRRVADTGGDA